MQVRAFYVFPFPVSDFTFSADRKGMSFGWDDFQVSLFSNGWRWLQFVFLWALTHEDATHMNVL